MPWAGAVRNCRQVGPLRPGAGSMPARFRIDHTARRVRRGSSITPGGVLRGQPQNQPAQCGCRAAACGAAAGLDPALLDQIPVPPQDRGWRDDPMQLAGRGQ
jgi:hypothetical protein